ncbi:MAG: hypothetical protein WC505_06320 [Patescibacteria group bacterium]
MTKYRVEQAQDGRWEVWQGKELLREFFDSEAAAHRWARAGFGRGRRIKITMELVSNAKYAAGDQYDILATQQDLGGLLRGVLVGYQQMRLLREMARKPRGKQAKLLQQNYVYHLEQDIKVGEDLMTSLKITVPRRRQS